jgi:hypothetical protein
MKTKTVIPWSVRETERLNDTLNHYPNITSFDRLCQIADRLTWLKRFHKIPDVIVDSLIAKTTGLFNNTWYGDEPEESVIKNYIKCA